MIDEKLVDISEAVLVDGWMSEQELMWLANIASKCAMSIEVGSWKGRSTLAIANHTQGVLCCVDAWLSMLGAANESSSSRNEAKLAYDAFQRNLSKHIDSGRVKITRARSVVGANMLLNEYGPKSFDWVFLDGDHSYEAVKSEIEVYSKLVRVGGLMSGHDYYFEGVREAVCEAFPERVVVPIGTTIWTHVMEG